MDQTTTLITFMLQTSPKTNSVHLVGSWDNFQRRYSMEKDNRRGRGQWRCCQAFKDIICDGDGPQGPKRDGGLKMGHTYWYYYELDDGFETHDISLPSTTACPFLPGQPVNILYVPVEVIPIRERSGSVGATVMEVKTMNPADKYLTPRAAPPTPRGLPRLNTSPATWNTKRSARSTSPSGQRSPWSARTLFGLRTPTTSASDMVNREPLVSPITAQRHGNADDSFPSMQCFSSDNRPLTSFSTSLSSREESPVSIRRNLSRDPSPLSHPIMPENNTHSINSTSLTIPDEITEEDEFEDEDDNFASHHPQPDPEKPHLTSLSPPPSRQRGFSPLADLRTAISEMKPLPMLPVETSPTLVPLPLRLVAPSVLHEAIFPRSHFSVDTISTGRLSRSPTDSNFSSTPSIYDSSNDEEDHIVDEFFDFGFASDTASRPTERQFDSGFKGYSLPNGEYDSEQTIRKESTTNPEATSAVTMVTGPRTNFGPQVQAEEASTLDQLLAEMGYLGGLIEGK